MECLKIVAHITRTDVNDKINKIIVAFGQRYHLVDIEGLAWNQVHAIYKPEDEILEDRYKQ